LVDGSLPQSLEIAEIIGRPAIIALQNRRVFPFADLRIAVSKDRLPDLL
jgi:hypothetical protein